MADLNLERLVKSAALGDERATDKVLHALLDDVHGLALRMLWHPIDAEIATEEILLELVAKMRELAREPGVRTGALCITAQFLLRTYQSPMERQDWNFDEMAEHLDRAIAEQVPAVVTDEKKPALLEEVKAGCAQTMLLCLDRPRRLAYVLVDILGMDESVAARIVGVAPAILANLVESARTRLHAFMSARCGVVNSEASCRCSGRLGRDLRTGRVDPRRLLFVLPDHVATAPSPSADPVNLFRSQPLLAAPRTIVDRVKMYARAKEPLELLRA